MYVASAIEIYTSVFGWIMYDQIWQILLDTGIVYFMLFGTFLRIAVQSLVRQGAVQGSIASIRESEIAVVSIFTVVILAGAPFINLRVGDLGAAQVCGASTTTGGNTGTTYDDAYAAINGKTGRVPVWWYGILAISSGITDAAIATVPCTPDFRVLDYKIDNTRIADPNLRRQLQLFADDCWRKALAKFNANQSTLPAGYSRDDTNWPGSQFFLDTNGYYGNNNLNLAMRASEEIPGFPYNANRDTDYMAAFIPSWGRPECKDWWLDRTAGLRKRILDQFMGSTLGLGTIAIQTLGGAASQMAAENLLIRKVFEGDSLALTARPTGDSLVVSAVANAAVHWETAWLTPKIYLLKQAAPIVQSYVLMGIYLLLPFIIVFSSFSIETVFLVTLAIFALKFCSALWAIATWLDDSMMKALGVNWYDHFFGHASEGTAEAVASLCSLMLFIALPSLWLMMLGWIGFKAVGVLSTEINNLNGPVGKAGDQATSNGSRLLTKGIGAWGDRKR